MYIAELSLVSFSSGRRSRLPQPRGVRGSLTTLISVSGNFSSGRGVGLSHRCTPCMCLFVHNVSRAKYHGLLSHDTTGKKST